MHVDLMTKRSRASSPSTFETLGVIFVQGVGGLLPIFDAFVQRQNECFHESACEGFQFLLDGFVSENQTCQGRADVSRGAFGVRGQIGDTLKCIEEQTECADR